MALPPCKFGKRCYRTKNKKHLAEFSHDFMNASTKNGITHDETPPPKVCDEPSKVHSKRVRTPSGGVAGQGVKRNRVQLSDSELLNDIKSKFIVSHPQEVVRFWNDLTLLHNETSTSDPCGVLRTLKNLHLVGVFRYLAGRIGEVSEADEKVYLTKDRFAGDLPEMQTVAVYDEGRFAYWRDTPNEDKPLLVHQDKKAEHFAKLDIIGTCDPVYMVAWMRNKYDLKAADDILAKLVHPDCALCNDNGAYDAQNFHKKYDSKVKQLKSQRRKESLGEPFHGMGIKVKVENDIGYRPLGERPGRLKALMEEVATSDNDELKSKLKEKIMEMVSYVQFANDEMDFGMGLELGHNLFSSNYADWDRLAISLLNGAYALLGRESFSRILNAHDEVRRSSVLLT